VFRQVKINKNTKTGNRQIKNLLKLALNRRNIGFSIFLRLISSLCPLHNIPILYNLRFSIWLDNRNKINEHNAKYAAGLVTYKQELNFLHDLDQEELKKLTGLNINAKNNARQGPKANSRLRKTTAASGNIVNSIVDWRNVSGYVQPVKNQGGCG